MEAPYGKGDGDDQQGESEKFPWEPVIVLFTGGLRHPYSHGCEDRRFLGRSFGLAGATGGHKIGDSLVFIKAEMAGIGADKTLVEDAARKLIETILLESGRRNRYREWLIQKSRPA